MMWHEARKQEKKIRGLMVDYQRRAERRRQFYERIKLDPTQFVRINGHSVHVHLEHSVAMAAESPQSMMPWQGDSEVMIDRFDVRAHLDSIPDSKNIQKPTLSKSELEEECRCNYERYRILVQNDCTGVGEEQCLHQIYLDEQCAVLEPKRLEPENKKKSEKKAAIGYVYEDSAPAVEKTEDKKNDDDGSDGDSDELSSSDEEDEVDLDIAFDVDDLTTNQERALNSCAMQYGMKTDDYLSSLHKDKEELEIVRQARLIAEEKAQFSGRKARRERRMFKWKLMKDRQTGLAPSYATRESPTYDDYKRDQSSSRSRSTSPIGASHAPMTFITSFGGNSDDEAGPVQGPSLPPSEQKNNTSPRVEHRNDEKESQKTPSAPIRRSDSGSYSRRPRSSGSPLPRRGSRSPHPRSRSPLRRSRSPLQRSKSPLRRSRSPLRRSRSPLRRSRSTLRRSRSPLQRSRSPCRRSPLRRSRSPRRRTPDRRFRSPVGRRSRSPGRTSCFSRSPRRFSRPSAVSPRLRRSPMRRRSWRSNSRSRRSNSRSRRSNSRSRRSNSRSRRSNSRSRRSGSWCSSSTSRSSSSHSRSPLRNQKGAPNEPNAVGMASEPPLKRYRRPSLSSNSDSDMDGTNDRTATSKKSQAKPSVALKGKTVATVGGSKVWLTPQERLKQRMRIQLNKQHKADKKAQREKDDAALRLRMDREDELRALAIQMRQRERDKRHREQDEEDENREDDNDDAERGRKSEDRGGSSPKRREDRGDSSPKRREDRDGSSPKRREDRGGSSPKRREDRDGDRRETERNNGSHRHSRSETRRYNERNHEEKRDDRRRDDERRTDERRRGGDNEGRGDRDRDRRDSRGDRRDSRDNRDRRDTRDDRDSSRRGDNRDTRRDSGSRRSEQSPSRRSSTEDVSRIPRLVDY